MNLDNYFEVLEVLFNIMPYVFWKDRSGVYRGANMNQAKAFGFHSPTDFIGKTIFEILEDQDAAKKIDDVDNKIMHDNSTVVLEESIGEKVYLSQKQAIADEYGNVAGLIGFAVDITILKEQEKLAMKEREQYRKMVDQMVHDIRTPLSSLQLVVQSTKEIPEEKRITLRHASMSISDITGQLLRHYKRQDNPALDNNDRQIVLISTLLSDIAGDRRYKYRDMPIKFEFEITQLNAFVFIKIEPSDLRRAVSNIINNAAESLPHSGGKIELRLTANDEWVTITILDDGKGIPDALLKKVRNKEAISHDKDNGHGIGLTQVRDTIERNYGHFEIISSTDKRSRGTTIELRFPRILDPDWIAEGVNLTKDDTIIILDDDTSIHGGWDSRLGHILKKVSTIKVKHFSKGQDVIDFVSNSSADEKQKICFLSDYELIGQELNGLQVIEKSGIKRSILVTSHYFNVDIRKVALQSKVKVLPKELVHVVPIQIVQAKIKGELVHVHLVFVDDEKAYTKTLISNYYSHLLTESYSNPLEFLDEIDKYPKETIFILDNYYYMPDGGTYNIDGVTIASKLHDKGYTKLIMLSGEEFNVPDYLKLVIKTDQESLSKLDKI